MPENHFGYISYLSNAAYSTHNFFKQTKSYLIEPPSTSMLPDSTLPRSIEIPYFKSNYTLLVKLEDLLINRNIQVPKVYPNIVRQRARDKTEARSQRILGIYGRILRSVHLL